MALSNWDSRAPESSEQETDNDYGLSGPTVETDGEIPAQSPPTGLVG
jgi:hypothetical protein